MRTKYSFINMIVGVAGQLVSIFLAFFSRMVFIHYLSDEHLGINGVFTNVLSVLSLAELGIGSAMIYSLYKPAAENDRELIGKLMNFYRLLYRCVAAAVFIMGLFLFPFLDYLVKGNSNVEHLEIIYLLYLLNSVFSYLYSYKNAILRAYQKAYYRTAWEHIMHIVQIILQIIVLMLTQNFILYLVIQMMNQVSVNLIVARKVDRDYPYLKEQKGLPEKSTCKSIAKNILALSMHKIGTVVVNGTDNLLMSAFVGLASAGIYSNYQMIFSNVNTLMGMVYNAFATSVGNLAAVENSKKVYDIYQVLDFLMFGIYGYVSVGIFVMINPLIKMIFGEKYLFSMPMVFVMAVSFYLNGMRQIVLQFRNALGLFWYDRYKPLAESAINLFASLILVRKYGVTGIILGTIISCLTTVFWVEPYVLFRYGMKDGWIKKLKVHFCQYVFRVMSVAGAAAVSYFLCGKIAGENIGWFLLKCGVCTGVYAVIFGICYFRCREFAYLKQQACNFIGKVIKGPYYMK